MKPLLLTMKNIGPFRNETIDFTALGDMFLISGKTGSGKTTIFDSMTYALYGELAGARKKMASSFRSDFASSDEDSYVEFTFRIDSRTYRVHRTLPVSYTNRNGKSAVKDTEVSLESKDKDGQWQTFSGKKNETNEKIEKDIIHLSADEFNQIVLLPQGSFAEFLRAGSRDKRDTLAKLFPVSFYQNIALRAKAGADSFGKDSSILESKLNDAKKDFSIDEAERTAAELEKAIAELKTSQSSLQKEMNDCTSSAEKSKALLLAAQKTQQLIAKKKELESKQKEIATLEEKLSRSIQAQKLASPLRAKTDAFARKQKCESDIAIARKNAAAASDAVTALLEQKDDIDELLVKTEKDSQALNELQKHLAQITTLTNARNEAAAAEVTLSQAKTKAEETESSITLTTFALLASAEQSKRACAEAEKLCSDTQLMIDELTAQQKAEELASLASTVASSLKENEPCPVCGSTVHPHVAQKNSRTLSLGEKITAEQKHLENARKNAESARAESVRFETTVAQLSETERSAAEKNMTHDAESNRTAEELSAELKKLRAQYKTDTENCAKAESVYAAAKASLAQIETTAGTETDVVKLKKQINDSACQIEKDKRTYASWQADKAQADKNQATAEATIAQLKENLESYTKEYAEAEKTFADSLALSPFTKEDEVRESLLTPETEKQFTAQTESWKEETAKTDALLAEQKVTAGSEPAENTIARINKELSALEQKRSLIADNIDKANDSLSEMSVKKAKLCERIELVKKLESDFASLQEKSKALIQLSKDLNGDNSKKTPFDAWVLAMYFEEVVEYANPRFASISGGRYQFKINTKATGGNSLRGLDLLVSDSYTGLDRDTATLSGGETFMASISLALALTDVVQNRSGGIRLDSLFIDEGFGTLDGDALDLAVSILRSIQEQRVVGIVSHVESLESVIPSMLEVIKGTSGSTIKIR